MRNSIPRIIIAALRGGSGKTVFSLGIISAWRGKGFRVAPFKKGPDFIDAGWLSLAADRPCHNLDPFLMSGKEIIHSFVSNSLESDISLIEGNRGLFDGLDLEGCCSTAELGKLIASPVVIIADVTMATRTIAAIIMGCQRFDPDLEISAVILNRVAGPRQESLVRRSIEGYCGIPVIGSVPKLRGDVFPERHMGLVPHLEREQAGKAIEWARSFVEENIDLDGLWKIAGGAGPLKKTEEPQEEDAGRVEISNPPRIGYIRDGAFWFYYPENLDQLKDLGATLVEIDSMTDSKVPDLDGLYIGGGFPEIRAKELADNKTFRDSLRQEIEKGLPVYAECGGLIYLGEELLVEGETFPMVGALPLRFIMDKKPQGHGYTILKVERENPFYRPGELIKGHEFHYSRPLILRDGEIDPVLQVQRGYGLDGRRDGLTKKNLFATYTHIHGGGNRLWGKRFFQATVNYRELVKKNTKMFTK